MDMLFSSVLIPLDASAGDRAAVRWAADVAGRIGLRVTLLLVRDPATLARLRRFAAAEDLSPADAAEAYLERLADPLRSLGSAVHVTSMPGSSAVEDIAWYAAASDVSLILLPVAEPAGRRRLGATRAQRLVAAATVPVLTVPVTDREAQPQAPGLVA